MTEAELVDRAKLEQKLSRDDPNDRDKFRLGPVGDGPEHWFEWGRKPSARTSLIIDPPDGRIPPFTPAGQARVVDPRRIVGYGERAGSQLGGPFNGPEDLEPRRPLHHTRPAEHLVPAGLQQRVSDCAESRARRHLLRALARGSRRAARRPRPFDRRPATVDGRFARALRRGHARHRRHQLQRSNELQAIRRLVAPRRALHAPRPRYGTRRDHYPGRYDVDTPLDHRRDGETGCVGTR